MYTIHMSEARKFRPRAELQNNLRTYREAKGMTLEKAADELGVRASTVDRWERGVCRPQATILSAISMVYGAPLGELMPYLGM